MARYAKVVFGLPLEGPFDYVIPEEFPALSPGWRVIVPFNNRKIPGFVVEITSKSDIPRLKAVERALDPVPVLSRDYLRLSKELSEYYCCSWGEMIETGLPGFMKQRRPIHLEMPLSEKKDEPRTPRVELIFSLSKEGRWQEYFTRITSCLKEGVSVLVLAPDAGISGMLAEDLKHACGIEAVILNKDDDYSEGIRKFELLSRSSPVVAVGLRSAVFSQIQGLALIIIEEEDNSVYKQEQTPCYHARDAAIIRARLEGLGVILGSDAPSSEAYYGVFQGEIKLTEVKEVSKIAGVYTVDMRNELTRFGRRGEPVISLELENIMRDTLAGQGKIAIFSNRSGFAHNIKCPSCGFLLVCPRCNVPLVAHLDKKVFLCRKCSYSTQMKDLCPNCNASYLRYFGYGIEKAEREVKRIFPQARVARFDKEETAVNDQFPAKDGV